MNQEAVWKPLPTQALALSCPATELLFGGSKGGGKTAYLVTCWVSILHAAHEKYVKTGKKQHKCRIMIFRKNLEDLKDFIAKTHEIYPFVDPKAHYHVNDKTWTFDSGATIACRHLDGPTDHLGYNGNEFCLARGSLVLMADGGAKPIEAVEIGDEVFTLEGPRRVLKTHRNLPRKACVKAETFDLDGRKIGEQFHPLDHRILTPDLGWLSYDQLVGVGSVEKSPTACNQENRPLPGSFDDTPGPFLPATLSAAAPSLATSADIGSAGNSPERREASRPVSLIFPAVLSGPRALEFLPRANVEASASTQRRVLGIYDGQCLVSLPGQKSESLRLVLRPEPSQQLFRHALSCESGSAQTCLSKAEDSPGGYRLDGGSCDESPRPSSEGDLSTAQSQGHAAGSSQTFLPADVLDNIRQRSRLSASQYAHRYTYETRPVTQPYAVGACKLTPAGKMDVFDLTIEGASHYVTEQSGLINSNCGLGFDEVQQISYEAYSFLVAQVRSSDPDYRKLLKVRATANPGGEEWVAKHFFIDECSDGGKIFTVPVTLPDGRVIENTRVFIRSFLKDNPYIDPDGTYEARLRATMSDDEVAQYLDGDFFRVAGSFFSKLLRNSVHFQKSRPIPSSWEFRYAIDWGSTNPACWLLGAKDNDGCLWIVDELHKPGGTGRKFGEDLDERFRHQKWCSDRTFKNDDFWGVIDKQAMDKHGGDETAGAGIMQWGFRLFEAKKDRHAGCNQMKERLMMDRHGKPQVIIFEDRCPNLVRALSGIKSQAPKDPDDYDDGSGMSHAADTFRFLCMEFPLIPQREMDARDLEVARWERYISQARQRQRPDEYGTSGGYGA